MATKYLVVGSLNAIISVHNKIECAEKAREKHDKKYPASPAIVAESNTTICSCKSGDKAVSIHDVKGDEPTASYIAKPSDSRCYYWCIRVPYDVQLNGEKITDYIRTGSDLELKYGEMLIESESMHHRKNRGYRVRLVVSFGDDIEYIFPTMSRKQFIKGNGGADLMKESGDVNGCIRMAVWLRRQPDLKIAFEQLKNAK